MQIGTIASGVGTSTTINLTWVPEFLIFTSATQLQSLKVTVLGDGVITDLDTAGINTLGRVANTSAVTSTYIIHLADGFIPGKNVEIIAVNGVAANISLYGGGRQKGKMYVQQLRNQAFAGSGVNLDDFAFAAFPSAAGAGADYWNVTYNDGTTQKWVREELQAILSIGQDVQNTASDYVISNLDQSIKLVSFVPAAQQTVYITRFAPAYGAVLNNSAIMGV